MYDPTMGRFISKDPIPFQDGPNPYGYARERPATFVDPFGLYSSGGSYTGGGKVWQSNGHYPSRCIFIIIPGTNAYVNREGGDPLTWLAHDIVRNFQGNVLAFSTGYDATSEITKLIEKRASYAKSPDVGLECPCACVILIGYSEGGYKVLEWHKKITKMIQDHKMTPVIGIALIDPMTSETHRASGPIQLEAPAAFHMSYYQASLNLTLGKPLIKELAPWNHKVESGDLNRFRETLQNPVPMDSSNHGLMLKYAIYKTDLVKNIYEKAAEIHNSPACPLMREKKGWAPPRSN